MLAISLLQAVRDNPNLPPDVRNNAVMVATQAVSYSSALIAQETADAALVGTSSAPVSPPIDFSTVQVPVVTQPVAAVAAPFQFTDTPNISMTCVDGVCTVNLSAKTNYPSKVKVQFALNKTSPFGAPQFESTEQKLETIGSWQVGSGVFQVLITAISDRGTINFQTQISG